MKRHVVRLALAWAALLLAAPAVAQSPQPEEVATELDAALAAIAVQREDIDLLDERAADDVGYMVELLTARRDRLWTSMFQSSVDLARRVVSLRDGGSDVSSYWGTVEQQLLDLAVDVRVALERVQSRAQFPTSDLGTRDFVIADQLLFAAIEEQDDLFRALLAYIDVAEDFGIDPSAEREYLVSELSDHAANLSVFLLKAQSVVDTLSEAVVTLPNDTELADWLNAAVSRTRLTASAMQETVRLMSVLQMETRLYRRQLLTATGEITADVLDVGIVGGLAQEWTRRSTELLASEGPKLLFRLLLVALILFVFIQFGKLARRLTEKALGSSRVQISNLLRSMIVSVVRNIVVLFGLLIAISQLGISLGPLLAGLGIAGFIVGFALQETLSNFASGVMILIYRPFDIGDMVRTTDVEGKVSHMSLVNTTFLTLDNQKLIVPNNMIWGSVITNVTAQYTRRVDLVFGISYDDDIEKADKILHEIIESTEAVLGSPEPVIRLHELADSSVNFVVRPWVKTADYWETYWAITRAVKVRFDEEGISIPYPQSDVHLIEPDKNA